MKSALNTRFESLPKEEKAKKAVLILALNSVEQGSYDKLYMGENPKGVKDPTFKGNSFFNYFI
jgi:hypothetical protein